MRAAQIDKSEAVRVKDILKELRSQGKVTMSGEKNTATYRLAPQKTEAAVEVLPES